jgi:hypothetical protein
MERRAAGALANVISVLDDRQQAGIVYLASSIGDLMRTALIVPGRPNKGLGI